MAERLNPLQQILALQQAQTVPASQAGGLLVSAGNWAQNNPIQAGQLGALMSPDPYVGTKAGIAEAFGQYPDPFNPGQNLPSVAQQLREGEYLGAGLTSLGMAPLFGAASGLIRAFRNVDSADEMSGMMSITDGFDGAGGGGGSGVPTKVETVDNPVADLSVPETITSWLISPNKTGRENVVNRLAQDPSVKTRSLSALDDQGYGDTVPVFRLLNTKSESIEGEQLISGTVKPEQIAENTRFMTEGKVDPFAEGGTDYILVRYDVPRDNVQAYLPAFKGDIEKGVNKKVKERGYGQDEIAGVEKVRDPSKHAKNLLDLQDEILVDVSELQPTVLLDSSGRPVNPLSKSMWSQVAKGDAKTAEEFSAQMSPNQFVLDPMAAIRGDVSKADFETAEAAARMQEFEAYNNFFRPLQARDKDLDEAVKAAREARKAARRARVEERDRIKPEAVRSIRGEGYAVREDPAYSERLEDITEVPSVSAVRQALESIGMGKNAMSKQQIVKRLSKQGVTKAQMESSGILALLDRKPNVTKEELVAQHDRFAPSIVVEERVGTTGLSYPDEQRIQDLAKDTPQYAPEEFFNYTETVIRNKNPVLAAGRRTENSHGMGGLKGAEGEIGHARTSQRMEPGVGRVEVIEEVQSDLHKLDANNNTSGSMQAKRKSVGVSIRNNKKYSEAASPKAEEAANMMDGWRRNNPVTEKFGSTIDKTSREIRRSATDYEDAIKNLETVLTKAPDDLGAMEAAHGRVVVAKTRLDRALDDVDSVMYDISAQATNAGDRDTAVTFNTWRYDEGRGGQGKLQLPSRDASDALRKTEDVIYAKLTPIATPRAIEMAESKRLQDLVKTREEAKQLVDEADGALRAIRKDEELLQQRLFDERAELSEINRRLDDGLNSPRFRAGLSVEQKQRMLEGDRINKKKIQGRIASLEKQVQENQPRIRKAEETAASRQSSLEAAVKRVQPLKTANSADEATALELALGRPVNPAIPFDTLNDTTQFIYETVIERAINNNTLNGVVLPDYRDVARLRELDGKFFKIGYEDAPKAVLKRLQERFPDIDITTTTLPGAEFPATLVKFPKDRTTDKPLIQGYAQGGMVFKGIGSMGKEVL